MTFDTRHPHATELIVSRVDYCNALLYGVTAYVLQPVQVVINAAARLSSSSISITLVLHDILHWLPVTQQIEYKTAMIILNSIHGTGPSYFSDVCVLVFTTPSQTSLLSANQDDVIVCTQAVKRLTHLFRCANDCLVIKCIVDNVDAHRLASLIVEVLKERSKVFQLEHSQQVVIVVYGKFHETHQFLRHRTARLQAIHTNQAHWSCNEICLFMHQH